jgi:hypothetical protein
VHEQAEQRPLMTRSRASSGGIDGGTTDGEGISGEGTGGGGEVEDEVFWDAGFRQNARHMVMDCLEVVVQQCSVNMVFSEYGIEGHAQGSVCS